MTTEEIRLLTKVATLYYKGNLSQLEIAQRLGLSRQSVGRLLQRASSSGIVHIEIHSPLSYASELELELEETFGLAEVIVITPPADTDDAIKTAIGQAGAEFLQRRIKKGDIVGVISGSTTVYECAKHLKPLHLQDVTTVSITGSAPHSSSKNSVQPIAYWFGKAFGGKTVLLPAPAFVDSATIKASLTSDSNIASILELGRRANVAVLGIGPISEDASPYRAGFLDHDFIQLLQQRGCVGEICGYAYNIHGEICSPELSARTIAIEAENLCEKELSVAMAGGHNKLEAIWGGLQGKYFNMLITDEETARALLARTQAKQANE